MQVSNNSKMLKPEIKGHISLKNIDFKYESRSEYLLRNFNIDVKPGEKVGLVGSSGCGKSSMISMLLRFYEPVRGEILIDGNNIKDYDIHYLREKFGVVTQEPVLFNTSFRGNILYNKEAS